MLVRDVTEAMENYDVLGATRPVADFVDTVSVSRRAVTVTRSTLGTICRQCTTVPVRCGLECTAGIGVTVDAITSHCDQCCVAAEALWIIKQLNVPGTW